MSNSAVCCRYCEVAKVHMIRSTAYLEKQRSIRTDQYKLLAYPAASTLRLYDVKKDPQEMKDLAADASMKPVVKELFGDLVQLQKRMNDDLDLSGLAP